MLSEFKKVIGLCALVAGVSLAAPHVVAGQEPAAQEAARKVLKKVSPAYPQAAHQYQLSGTVKLAVLVNPDGTVKSVKTMGGNAILALAAETAVRLWKYEPAKRETAESVAVKFEANQ